MWLTHAVAHGGCMEIDSGRKISTWLFIQILYHCTNWAIPAPNDNIIYMIFCCTPYSQSTMPSKLHTSPTATPLAPNFWMNKIQNCLHVLECNHRFRSLLSFWATYYTFTVLPALSALRQTHACSFPLSPIFVRHTHAQTPTLQPQNPWLSHFLTLRPPHIEQSPPRHQALCYSLFLQRQTQGILFSEYFS